MKISLEPKIKQCFYPLININNPFYVHILKGFSRFCSELMTYKINDYLTLILHTTKKTLYVSCSLFEGKMLDFKGKGEAFSLTFSCNELCFSFLLDYIVYLILLNLYKLHSFLHCIPLWQISERNIFIFVHINILAFLLRNC